MFSLRFLGTWAFVVVCLVGCGTFEAEAEHQGSPTPQPLPVGALLERRSSLPAPTLGFNGQRALDHVVQQARSAIRKQVSPTVIVDSAAGSQA